MEKHVTVVAILNLVFGVIKILVGGFLFIVIAGGGLLSGDPEAMAITSIVGTVLAIVFVLLAIPEIIAGLGLLKYQRWARILTIIIAVLDLIQFPVGTLIGIYELWVMLDEKTMPLFEKTT